MARIEIGTVLFTITVANDVLLYPNLGLALGRTQRVLTHVGWARIKLHVLHTVEGDGRQMPVAKCPNTDVIQNDISVQLGTSLTKVSEELSLQPLVRKESVNNLFGVKRGRRSTVSPVPITTSTSVFFDTNAGADR